MENLIEVIYIIVLVIDESSCGCNSTEKIVIGQEPIGSFIIKTCKIGYIVGKKIWETINKAHDFVRFILI